MRVATTTHILIGLVAIGLALASGCNKKNHDDPPAATNIDYVCPQLYQGTESLADALAFIEVPDDRMESSLDSVSRRGKLPNAQQLAFANTLFSLHETRDVELFRSLLSDGTRKELDGPDTNKQLARLALRQVENGTFIYSGGDDKFFATFAALAPDDLESISRNLSFVEQPTDVVFFWHFYRPQRMLVGSQSYLIQDGNSCRLVAGTLLRGELPPLREEADPNEPKIYGIASFEQDDEAYSKENAWRYKWTIELTLEESENNTFEIIKLTDVVAGEAPDLHPNVAKDILIEEAVFSKYRYKELKFRFYVGANPPGDNHYRDGQKMSGWSHGLRIASMGQSSSMLFPGVDVTNIQARQKGGFIDSDLELLSFETSSGDIRYRHRVVLRKTPMAETSGT